MGVVMVSLDERHEALLRQLATYRYQGRKGALSKVVESALDREAAEDAHLAKVEAAVAHMRKGFITGVPKDWVAYKSRAELYER